MKPKREPERPPTADELIDTAGEDSFPASDPPARTAITGVGTLPTKPGKAPTLPKVHRPRRQPKKRP
mgnify:CR=1 FL=1